MSNATDTQHKKQPVSSKAVIASRGTVSQKAWQLVRNLPLQTMRLVAVITENDRHRVRQAGSYACAGRLDETESFYAISSPYELSKACTSEGEQIEAIYRNGDLIRETADIAHSNDIAMTILYEENCASPYRKQVVKDASAILRRTKKPVLVAVGESRTSTDGNILVAIDGCTKQAKLENYRIDRLAIQERAEIVVLSVAGLFWPVFSRVSINMRSWHSSAMREVHESQVQDATADAIYLCDRIRAGGVKSWAIGKVGKLVPETLSVAESCDCALICMLVDDSCVAHERRIRSMLTELLRCAKSPILMLPSEAGVY
ncbi:MAG: hypothetical protein ACYC27_07510 [Armatimonadota bacterium]